MDLIFDFDGTLVNSFPSAMLAFNRVAVQLGFAQIALDEIDNLRDLSSQELIDYLQVPRYKIPRMILQARKEMNKEIGKMLPIAHLTPVLKTLKADGISLGILTSNSQKNVTEWLESQQIADLFNFIQIETSYFGKARVLKKLLAAQHIDREHAFYIGDETRDIEAAKQCNIYSVAVTWGFNSEKVLSQYNPHHIVRKPADILAICKAT